MKRHQNSPKKAAEDQQASIGSFQTPSVTAPTPSVSRVSDGRKLEATKTSKQGLLPRFRSREVARGNGLKANGLNWISLEKALLGTLFSLALAFGYIASNRLWNVQLAERESGLTYDLPLGLASTLGFAVDYGRRQVAGVTRQEYLRYFRPLFEGDTKVDSHDKTADGFVSQLLRGDFEVQNDVSSHGNVEDELWVEDSFVANQEAVPEEILAARQRLSEELDELIAAQRAAVAQRAAASKPAPLAFAPLPTASLNISSRGVICPEVATEQNQPFNERRRITFVLGAQKCGTTFLFSALSKHPDFIGATHAFGQKPGRWAKEVHFYNRWPQPVSPKRNFLKCFPKKTWTWDEDNPAAFNYTLLDGTPEYLFNPMVAPRIKQMWPQARFIVLLRDPVMRAFSAWKMTMKMYCKLQARHMPSKACDFPSFAELIIGEFKMLQGSQCLFHTQAKFPKTWGDCYRCSFSFVDDDMCVGDLQEQPKPCTAPPFLTLSVGDYAAQLSWWFAFFPPETFKIVLSADLHTAPRLPLLDSMSEFVGLKYAEPFTNEMLRGVWGYEGGYDLDELSELDVKAMQLLRLVYSKMNEDLVTLLRGTEAHADFAGIPNEIDPDAVLQALLQQKR